VLAPQPDVPLPDQNLRRALRAQTASQHQLLDDAVGSFATVEAYGRFVANSLAFRAPVERLVAQGKRWSLLPLADLMRADMADLDVVPRRAAVFSMAPGGFGDIGVAYVLEGSALGARLLVRRAAALGYGARYGARHLARQVEDPARWKRFLALLETIPDREAGAVVEGAVAAFAFALGVYTVEAA